MADFRYAMRSARSPFFLMPAKIILVPGMYFLGFSKYSIRVSSPHIIPEDGEHRSIQYAPHAPCHYQRETTRNSQINMDLGAIAMSTNKDYSSATDLCSCWRPCTSSPLPGPSCARTDPRGWAPLCSCPHPQQCDTGNTSGRRPSFPLQCLP